MTDLKSEDIEIGYHDSEWYCDYFLYLSFKHLMNIEDDEEQKKALKALKKDIVEALEFKKTWVNTEHTLTTTKHYNDLKKKADRHDYVQELNDGLYYANEKLEATVKRLEEENKQLREFYKKHNRRFDGLKTLKESQKEVKQLKEVIKQVRQWYGINQIYTPTEEAIKIIKIIDTPELKEILGEKE